MLVVSRLPGGALSGRRLPAAAPTKPLFSSTKQKPCFRRAPFAPPLLSLSPSADADGRTSRAAGDEAESPPVVVTVADEGVPVEGVIRMEGPAGAESKLLSYAKVGFLAGGDALCLLAFAAIGRLSHGLPVQDVETLRTADPFVAGWLLGAYFLGAYGEDGKGVNGTGNAVVAAAKSWSVGIPIGLAIRAATSGHFPPTNFILIAMGSTGVLLISWRALAAKLLSTGQKQDDVYRRGSPFELFELLTSLVRRW